MKMDNNYNGLEKNMGYVFISWIANICSYLDRGTITFALATIASIVAIANGVLLFYKNLKNRKN